LTAARTKGYSHVTIEGYSPRNKYKREDPPFRRSAFPAGGRYYWPASL
jgi:hypothetical protein